MTIDDLPFREIVVVDFEYGTAPGCHPEPRCMVANELRSGRRHRLWADELRLMSHPPFSLDDQTLYVSFFAPAEQGCHLSLGWPLPLRVLDLSAEHRNNTSGLSMVGGKGLLAAMLHYGLPCLDAMEKDELRLLALRGGWYTDNERKQLLDYCEADVVATAKLLVAMLQRGHVDLARAVLRGRYTSAVSRMEHTGTPIDVPMYNAISANWDNICHKLIGAVDEDFDVYDGLTFKTAKFEAYLNERRIAWPHRPDGGLCLDDQTFRDMAKAHLCVAPLHELRSTLSGMRRFSLAVGPDGRNRTSLWPFSTKTGRNAPRASEFVFSPSTWVRFLIRPTPGRALAYLDYSGQEFAIAAVLSGDQQMLAAYESGDPYIYTAKFARVVPPDATKKTHPTEREIYKVVALAVGYGQGEFSLASRLCIPIAKARELLQTHRELFSQYWSWSDRVEAQAMLTGSIRTCFGWHLHVSGIDANPRSIRNFMLQGTGSEIMRLATSAMTEAGISVCAPVHDGFLIEADESEIDHVVLQAKSHMEQASRIVLDGFTIRVDAKVIRYPDRVSDPRGVRMWEIIQRLLGECRPLAPALPRQNVTPSAGATPTPSAGATPVYLFRSLFKREIDAVPTPGQHGSGSAGGEVASVPQGPRTDPVVETGVTTTGQDVGRCGGHLVEGRMHPSEGGRFLSTENEVVGVESVRVASVDSSTGAGGSDFGQEDTRSWIASDDSQPTECVGLTTLLAGLPTDTHDNVRFEFDERAGVHEFDGGMSRCDAERLALAHVGGAT